MTDNVNTLFSWLGVPLRIGLDLDGSREADKRMDGLDCRHGRAVIELYTIETEK